MGLYLYVHIHPGSIENLDYPSILPRTFQLFQILNLKSILLSLIPVQAPIDLSCIDLHSSQSLHPVQDLPLLFPGIRLGRFLPTDSQALHIRPTQPLSDLLDSLLDLRDPGVGFNLFWFCGTLFGAEVDGEMDVFYRGSERRGEDQIATRRLVPPEIVIDRYVDYLGRAAVEDG